MDLFKEYLETSTIHGMIHISTSSRYFRLFWVLVVAGGFITAGQFISTNFDEWNQHPVITAMETLDISQMKFPNITICPPRRKYTSLNYDISLVDSGQISLTEDTRRDLIQHVTDVAYRGLHLEVKSITEMFDREFYQLWYEGDLIIVSQTHLQDTDKEIELRGSHSFGLVSDWNISVSTVVNNEDLVTSLEISLERNDSRYSRILGVTNDTYIDLEYDSLEVENEGRPETTK